MRTVNTLIWHYTATPAGRDVSVKEISSWHRKRGFRTIGYHWIVGLDGRIHAGRPEHEVGAHCRGHNENSLGLCFVGGGDGADTRTDRQKWAMEALTRFLVLRYPIVTVCGHRDCAETLCPGFDVGATFPLDEHSISARDWSGIAHV